MPKLRYNLGRGSRGCTMKGCDFFLSFHNVGLDSAVGRAPARQSGGRRFKSRSSKFFFVHPNLSKKCTQSVFLVVYGMIYIIMIENWNSFWIIKIGLTVIKLLPFYCFCFHEIFVKFFYGAFGSRGVILVLFTIVFVNKLVSKWK